MKTYLTFISSLLLFSALLQAQCPDRDFLWHRIIFLRDSSKVEESKQLNELLNYENVINQCSYNKDSVHVLLLQRIGWLYTSKNDFFNAIQYTSQSIALINKDVNYKGINPAHAIKSYWNLQLMFNSLRLENKGRAALDSCITIAYKLRQGYEYAFSALTIKLKDLFKDGDYYGCLYYAKLGESMLEETNSKDNDIEEFKVQCFSMKINSFIFLKKNDEVIKILSAKIHLAESRKEIKLLSNLYSLYGLAVKEKNPVEAIEYFKKSFQYNNQLGRKNQCAEALNNIGFTFSENLHQNDMALPYYFKALKYSDANESLNIFSNIANVHAKSARYDSAFIYFQNAFNQLGKGFNETDLLKEGNTQLEESTNEYIAGMLLDKAFTYLGKYKATGDKKALTEAIRIYEITDRYFDKLRASQYELQSKLFWKTNNRRLYEQAIEACYTNGNNEKAFYFFEKSRSVLLADQITEQQQMNDRDIAKQAQLKKNIFDIEDSLKNTVASSSAALDLQQQLFTNKQELGALIKTIGTVIQSSKKNLPDSASLTLTMVRQKITTQNKSLLEIFAGDSAVYILALTSQKTSFVKLNKHLYDSLTNSYIYLISKPITSNKELAAFSNTSQQLYQLIFGKLQLTTGGSLIVSPDGKSFPFEALVTGTKNGQPEYLLYQFATSYTYSASYLMNEYAANTKSSNNMLGLAPVKYASSMGLAELSGSDLSLQKIKAGFPNATNLIFGKATKHNFFQQFPGYAIVQLYTHAADSSPNNDPVIYFADSSMLLSELIIDRKPITQLVVLSACETANGKLYEGEGIFSFNRGFAALGIPAAVSNLWSVENEATYAITELFYTYLAQGLPTDIALQKAKIEFISNSTTKEKKLPYYWAGPILTGKVDTITVPGNTPWKTILITGITVLAAGFFAGKYFLKNKRNQSTKVS